MHLRSILYLQLHCFNKCLYSLEQSFFNEDKPLPPSTPILHGHSVGIFHTVLAVDPVNTSFKGINYSKIVIHADSQVPWLQRSVLKIPNMK